jgi:hypothetical protein
MRSTLSPSFLYATDHRLARGSHVECVSRANIEAHLPIGHFESATAFGMNP